MKTIIKLSLAHSGRDTLAKSDSMGTQKVNWEGMLTSIAPFFGVSPRLRENARRTFSYWMSYRSAFPQDNKPFQEVKKLLELRDALKLILPEFDELISEGSKNELPERFKRIVEVERKFDSVAQKGFPELTSELLDSFAERVRCGGDLTIELFDDITLYPKHFRDFLLTLGNADVALVDRSSLPEAQADKSTYLGRVQRSMKKYLEEDRLEKLDEQSDDSLKLYFDTGTLRESAITVNDIQHQRKVSELAVLYPAAGSRWPSEVAARLGLEIAQRSRMTHLPVVQLLRSAFALLWEPRNLEDMYEFLLLPLKPLDKKLSNRLLRAIEGQPGYKSKSWISALETFKEEFLENTEDDDFNQKNTELDKKLDWYTFWLENEVYQVEDGIPIGKLDERLNKLGDWARGYAQVTDNDQLQRAMSLLDRIIAEFLRFTNSMGEKMVQRDDMEALLSLVLESGLYEVRSFERCADGFSNHLPTEAVMDYLYWLQCDDSWSFGSKLLFFAQEERFVLDALGLNDRSELYLSHYRFGLNCMVRALLLTRSQACLYLPGNGADDLFGLNAFTSLLVFGLECQLEGIAPKFPIEKVELDEFKRPGYGNIFELEGISKLIPRQRESYSSLKNLVHTPHEYVINNVLGIRPSEQFQLIYDQRVRGRVIHAIAEDFLTNTSLLENVSGRETWEQWVDLHFDDVLLAEASVMLLPKMNEAKALIKKEIKEGLYPIIQLINQGWRVYSAEQSFEGLFKEGVSITGNADIILQKNEKYLIVDFKTGSGNDERQVMKDGEDWQLMIYSKYAVSQTDSVVSAYLFTKNGAVLTRGDIPELTSVERPPNDINVDEQLREFKELCEAGWNFISAEDEVPLTYTEAGAEMLRGMLPKVRVNKYDQTKFFFSNE